MPVRYGSLPFKQQIDFFRGKENIPTESWNAIWKQAHNQAFVVAGAMKVDMLADFRQAVDQAIADGKSLNWFKNEFKNIQAKYGWDHTGSAAFRSRVIYQTNMLQSYNAGRWEQLQNFEYWRYAHGGSRDPRIQHVKWNGLVLAKDNVFWQTHFPSNGWGCKCKVYGESKGSLKRKGLTVSNNPKIEYVNWVDKTTGEEHKVPVGIDPSFDYAPHKQNSPDKVVKRHIATKPPLKERLTTRHVPTSFSTQEGVDNKHVNNLFDQLAKRRPEMELVSKAINKQKFKALFLRPSEMVSSSRKAHAIAKEIAPYLGLESWISALRIFSNRKGMIDRTNGFCFENLDHVVVKTKSGTNFGKVKNIDELLNLPEVAIAAKQHGQQAFSMSSIIRQFGESKHHGGAFVTYLHEIGHLMHFRAVKLGVTIKHYRHNEAVTHYGNSNPMEWHAEHFVLWALGRKHLVKYNPDIAEYFDKLMKELI